MSVASNEYLPRWFAASVIAIEQIYVLVIAFVELEYKQLSLSK